MKSFLITGANGFVGQALCDKVVAQGFEVKGATRILGLFNGRVQNVAVGAIDGDTDWTEAFQGGGSYPSRRARSCNA